MNRKFALTALSVVIVLGGVSGAMAGGGKGTMDPRQAYKFQGGNHESACDVNPQCNGWAKWFQGVRAGKKYSHQGPKVLGGV